MLLILEFQALPTALAINNSRASIPNLIITNSGSMRFDIYSGPFTKNDQLTVSPFTDSFLFIPNIPAGIANGVFAALNGAGADERRSLDERDEILYGRGYVDREFRRWLEEMDRRDAIKKPSQNLTLGYVTQDVSYIPCFNGFVNLVILVLPRSWR